MLFGECAEVGVCCDERCCGCLMKKSTRIFSLSPDRPDTSDGTALMENE